MGPPENLTVHLENQEGRRGRLPCRPRTRCCLLKGCEQRFHPQQVRQRYCGHRCREAARKWSRRKAQERYRETAAGQQKRNGQIPRYRERVKSRKKPEPEAARARTPRSRISSSPGRKPPARCKINTLTQRPPAPARLFYYLEMVGSSQVADPARHSRISRPETAYQRRACGSETRKLITNSTKPSSTAGMATRKNNPQIWTLHTATM